MIFQLQKIGKMLHVIPRAVKSFRIPISSATFSLSQTFCDKKNDEKGTPTPKPQTEEKAQKAKDSLNKLLASMNTNHEVGLKKIELRKPGAARKQKKQKEKQNDDGSSSSDDEKKPRNIQEAVKKVASTIDGGQPAVGKEVESELLRKLLNIGEGSTSNLSEIFSNILVDREDKKPTASTFVRRQQTDGDTSRAERVRRNLVDSDRTRFNDKHGGGSDKRGREHQRPPREQIRVLQTNISGKSVNLFGSEPLGIFRSVDQYKVVDLLPTWSKLEQRELKQTVTHPPANYFEKMMLWTEQGKLWKFPIDNEQGRDEEAKVYFTDHIFLEQHLESWCPSKGPIRHFMELVCVGLSKNHYITAQEKFDHINWFRDYFEQKREILESVIMDNTKTKSTPKLET